MYDFVFSICHSDRSVDGFAFSFGIFVNKCARIPTDCTLLISGGFHLRKSNSCSIHISAPQVMASGLSSVITALQPSLPSPPFFCRPFSQELGWSPFLLIRSEKMKLQGRMRKCVQSQTYYHPSEFSLPFILYQGLLN